MWTASRPLAAQDYIERTYGDVNSYLTTKIEAEVRAQKLGGLLTIEN